MRSAVKTTTAVARVAVTTASQAGDHRLPVGLFYPGCCDGGAVVSGSRGARRGRGKIGDSIAPGRRLTWRRSVSLAFPKNRAKPSR
jgi:hypothetical protein